MFKALALARIIERPAKLDSERVLVEVGAWMPSYATIKCRWIVERTLC